MGGECNSLTIENGTVNANGSPGIGAASDSTLESLLIVSGNVSGTGEAQASGIGAGTANGSTTIIKNLTIVDGTIDAFGAASAGIGSSCTYASASSIVYNLTILDGNITAGDSSSFFGIGCGNADTGSSIVETLIIANGNIIATPGSADSVGIGAGCAFQGGISVVNDLAILNGNITATAGWYSAAIGSGNANGGGSETAVRNLTIVNGNIFATGGVDGAGIGTGFAAFVASSNIGNLTILRGNITAIGYTGIGASPSYAEEGCTMVENLIIANGNITAIGVDWGTGIGTGCADNPSASSIVGNLVIGNGNVTAKTTGDDEPGIGSGPAYDGESTVHNLTILNGNISALGGTNAAGIGVGLENSRIETLSIFGGTIDATGDTVAIGSPVDEVSSLRFSGTADLTCNFRDGPQDNPFPVAAESIVLSNASLSFATRGTQLFRNTLSVEGTLNLAIFYGSVTTGLEESLADLGGLFLQIGNVSLPSMGGRWTFCVRGGGPSQCFATEATEVKSVVVSVPSADSYSMWAHRRFKSVLITNTTGGKFEVSTSSSFFDEAALLAGATCSPTSFFTPALQAAFSHRGRRIYQLSLFTIVAWWK
jgi:hypothetical protein